MPGEAFGSSVLVTGAGGFVGGHVARRLASAGYRVRALTRREPESLPGDPPIEWVRGDLCREVDVAQALLGINAVIHTAGWVSLGSDRSGESRRVNVEATGALLDLCEEVGVERFVYTSTLWTTAAGTPGRPADEETPWNLEAVQGPYCDSKREAERLVLGRSRLRTSVICPGLVVGPRDRRPTSTGLFLRMAAARVVALPEGGIPLVDAGVLALAHQRALEVGTPGERYVVAGGYLSYREMARLVGRVAGRPEVVLSLADILERPARLGAKLVARLLGDRAGEVSEAAVAGGFLRLHVSGARADVAFGLNHPPVIRSIYEALEDHRVSGRAPWLRLTLPAGEGFVEADEPAVTVGALGG